MKKQIGHAYLFSGPRGTGKTTVARLLSRAVNCIEVKDQPCNECARCQLVASGKAIDIIEIDAASNRGIDEIRSLREKIAFAPTELPYKVYIIDEVHMLTKEAFNALLKTLEEPPGHAIFILATTELHRVPETIISRCQRFQFYRATPEQLAATVSQVAAAEGLTLSSGASSFIARRAEGSYRDALTLLGNLAFTGKNLDESTVRELLGLPPSELSHNLVKYVLEGQAGLLIREVAEYLKTGGDLTALVKAMAQLCQEQIWQDAPLAQPAQLATLLEELLASLARARVSSDPASLLLARLIRLAVQAEPTKVAATPAMTDLQKAPTSHDEESVSVDSVAVAGGKASDTNQFWRQFLEEVKQHNHALYAICRSARLEALTTDKLTIAVKFRFYSERLYEPKNRRLVEDLASRVAGRALILECLVKTDLDLGRNSEEDLLSTVVDVFELNEVG